MIRQKSFENEYGQEYKSRDKNASVLYDYKDGAWKSVEMVDRRLNPTYVTIK